MHWLLAAIAQNPNWYLLPLAVVISLVYAATRHEDSADILRHAARFFVLVVGFMLVVFGVLLLISWRL
ncbi:MAG: hypothetical protein ACOC46_03500 [Pirellulales bacterium]